MQPYVSASHVSGKVETWAFVVTDSVDAHVGQQVTALATLANEGRCLDLLRTDCGRFVRSHLSGERRCSPYEAHVSRSSGHPPTPIDPARLARRGFAFDFAEVALDESDYLGVPCGDVDLVLHE